jgi:hypothetical protein
VRTRLALALATLAAATVAAPAAHAAPAAYGTTTFGSTNGGTTTFVLPRASTFHLGTSMRMPEVSVIGGGRIAGIVIAAEGATLERGAVLYAFRFNWCWSRGCETPRDTKLPPASYAGTLHAGEVHRDDGVTVATLPAGRYTAHVVADGAPATVTVRFDGARGRGRLGASRPLGTTFATAESTLPDHGALPVSAYSAGGTARVRSPIGVLLSMNEARLRGNVTDAEGTCLYENSGPPNGVFGPGCPGGQASPLFVLNGFLSFHVGSATIALVRGERDGVEWTQGAYRTGVHEDEWLSPTVLLWVEAGG